LRHQIAVLQRSAPRRVRLKQSDRLLWILLSRLWRGWRPWVYIVKPDTVVRWLRRAFLSLLDLQIAPSSWKTSGGCCDSDFFTVPTALFRVLFVFVVLSHDRRRVVHFI
jgi:hypothetical protein